MPGHPVQERKGLALALLGEDRAGRFEDLLPVASRVRTQRPLARGDEL